MKEVAQRTEQATKSAQQMMSADGGSAVVSVRKNLYDRKLGERTPSC